MMIFVLRREISELDNDMHEMYVIEMPRKTSISGSRARTGRL